jgi:arylsulfatase A-like enzyme
MYLMEEYPKYREDDEYLQYLAANGYGNIASVHGVRNYLYMRPQQSLLPDELHGSSFVADKTIALLEERDGSRPFMYWTSFIAPHPPFNVPADWAHLYDDIELPAPLASKTPLCAIAEGNKAIAEFSSREEFRRAVRLYHCSVAFVDYQIGKIIDKLKEKDLYDNTLVIFTSDHGEMLGDYGTFQKFLPYDQACRIPFICKPPKENELQVSDNAFIDLYDILPTFLDITQVSYPAEIKLPGESLFSSEEKRDRNKEIIEYNQGNKRWLSITDGKFKFNYFFGDGQMELFDLTQAGNEAENLLCDQKDTYTEISRPYYEELKN